MNYKLRGSNNYNEPLHTFLENRGVNNIDGYLNLSEEVIIPYQNLAHINEAVELYKRHIENNSNITIVIDPDVDGFTSAAMIYKYTNNLNPECKLTYLLHTGKGHGLTDEITIPEDTQLLIIPDGGTNDTKQCETLRNIGVDILILDHHEQEKSNPYAVIVNNQCSPEYNNKQLCGAGIVYKFLEAVDDDMWNEDADTYLDLVALANISDNMDMKEFETKYLVSKGISLITNPLFEKLIEAQSYFLPEVDMIGIQFYITPMINALVRVGTQEEKSILFRAFIGDESETFEYEYKKNGEKKLIQENIYERAARFCSNAKGRQDRAIKNQLPNVIEHIENKGQNENEVIVTNVTDFITGSLTGVLAIKIASHFHKPTILLRDCNDDIYAGSMRVPDNNPIENFKSVLNEKTFFSAQGHAGACGVSIYKQNIKESIELLNDYIRKNNLAGISDTLVDFEIDYEDFDIRVFNDIASLKPYYATGLKESKVVIKNIPISPDDVTVQGKESNSWFVMLCDDSIKLVAFKRDIGDTILNLDSNININVVGTIGYSYYKGIKTAQIIVQGYEVI